MNFPQLKLELSQEVLAVCRFATGTKLPAWSDGGSFQSVTKTSDEVSLVCEQALVPLDVKCEREWRCFKVAGPLDFSLTGILSSLVGPLALAKIPVFAISTFDTDYLLVKQDYLEKDREVFSQAGHTVS